MGILRALFGRDREENVFQRLGLKREDIQEIRINGRPVMTVEDRFLITGRGVVLTGQLLMDVQADQPVELILTSGQVVDPGDQPIRIKGVEHTQKQQSSAASGEQVGVLIG